MKILELLNAGESLDSIVEKYRLLATRHKKYPELTLLKYDQLNSPMHEPVVQECRGLIINTNNNEIVSFPFIKFWNEGEALAAKIDWSSARVQNKLDGSLATLYWYNGEWHVATSGTPDATGNVNDFGFTFAELFWKTFNDMGLKLPHEHHEMATTNCYMWELTTPYNRIVVKHQEPRLTLIGSRQIGYGYPEYPIAQYAKWGYPIVQEFGLSTLAEIQKTFDTMDPLEQEGYVVVDRHFNRIKIKHPGYVALHHLRGNGNPTMKSMLEVVRTNEGSELLASFPEWKPMYEDIRSKYESFIHEMEYAYVSVTNAVNATGIQDRGAAQKEFALLAVKTKCPDVLFMLRAKKVNSVKEYLDAASIDKAYDLVNK